MHTLWCRHVCRHKQANIIFSPSISDLKIFFTPLRSLWLSDCQSFTCFCLCSLSGRWLKLVSRLLRWLLGVPTAGESIQCSVKHETLFISQFLLSIVSYLQHPASYHTSKCHHNFSQSQLNLDFQKDILNTFAKYNAVQCNFSRLCH